MDWTICPKCGGYHFDTTGNCMDCRYNPAYKSYSSTYTLEPFINQGWQCPVCKRVMAPFMSYCSWCCNPNGIDFPIITCGDAPIVQNNNYDSSKIRNYTISMVEYTGEGTAMHC